MHAKTSRRVRLRLGFNISFFTHSQTQQSHGRKVGQDRIVEMDCNCRIYFTSGQRRVLLHFCSEILDEGTHDMMLLFFLSLTDIFLLYWAKFVAIVTHPTVETRLFILTPSISQTGSVAEWAPLKPQCRACSDPAENQCSLPGLVKPSRQPLMSFHNWLVAQVQLSLPSFSFISARRWFVGGQFILIFYKNVNFKMS